MTPVLEFPASGHPSDAKVKTFAGQRHRISDLLSQDLLTLLPPSPLKKINCYKRARNEKEDPGKRDRPQGKLRGGGGGGGGGEEYDLFFSTLHPTDPHSGYSLCQQPKHLVVAQQKILQQVAFTTRTHSIVYFSTDHTSFTCTMANRYLVSGRFFFRIL